MLWILIIAGLVACQAWFALQVSFTLVLVEQHRKDRWTIPLFAGWTLVAVAVATGIAFAILNPPR